MHKTCGNIPRLIKMDSEEIANDPWSYYLTLWYKKLTNEPVREFYRGETHEGRVAEINGNRILDADPSSTIIYIKLSLWGINTSIHNLKTM